MSVGSPFNLFQEYSIDAWPHSVLTLEALRASGTTRNDPPARSAMLQQDLRMQRLEPMFVGARPLPQEKQDA
ncbi:hypothetical protein [Reyranella sp.]|uniref:hypothetical protein n=1 Tax=Reyranella sp. TaxID=1929291 RepID=UPI003C7CF2FE